MTVFSRCLVRIGRAANVASTIRHQHPECHFLVIRGLSLHAERAAVSLEEREDMEASRHDLRAQDLTFPTYVVWGAGTGIGKTLVSAGLTAAVMLHTTQAQGSSPKNDSGQRGSEARRVRDVLYLKPVQTGFPKDSDASFVMQQVHRSLLGRPLQEEIYLSNHSLRGSPAVHNAVKTDSSSALVSDLSGVGPSSGMKDLCRYDAQVVGLDKDKAGPGEALGAGPNASQLACKTLWSWFDPVSPHLAALKEDAVVTDTSLLESVKHTIWNLGWHPVSSDAPREPANSEKWAIIETAGGVASPAPSGTLQCDVYRPLRLPGLLVGDGKLGGISSTIAAYESLHLRGYDIDAVILVDGGVGNEEALRNYFRDRIPVLGLSPVPENPAEDLGAWYLRSEAVFAHLRSILEQSHLRRIDRLQSMPEKAMTSLWWPFTQHSLVSKEGVTVIDSRSGENFSVFEVEHERMRYVMKNLFDGCASWWTQGPSAELQLEFAKEMAYAAGRYGHVMFPENVHEPSLLCAELLLKGVGQGWADRVYYSDNGSTAVEIAIKMAFRKFAVDHGYAAADYEGGQLSSQGGLQFKVLALKGSYHGDTLGAMEAQAPSAYTGFLQQPWYSGRGLFLDPPTVSLQSRLWHLHLPDAYVSNVVSDQEGFFWKSREDVFSESRDVTNLAEVYSVVIEDALSMCSSSEELTKIGALIMEPVVHAAGGMHMVDPLFQRTLVKKCKQRRIPVIFDEVFAGCWRLGAQSAGELLRITPDVACYSKLLTGGMVPLAVTLASDSVYEVFRGQSKLNALLHGHSYSAHPLGCVAAISALQSFADPSRNSNLDPLSRRLKELWDPQLVETISEHPAVKRVVSIGTLFALELKADPSQSWYTSMQSKDLLRRLRQSGVYLRPLGNVVYLLCGPTTQPPTCKLLLENLISQLD